MHGGNAPKGIASPHFKHGKNSKYLNHLPAALAPHFDPDRPQLVELTEEIALIEATVIEALTRGGKKLTKAVRQELGALVERKARLVAVESRRRKDEHEMVSAEQFGQFARAALMSIATHVSDPKARADIQADILRFLTLSQGPIIAGQLA